MPPRQLVVDDLPALQRRIAAEFEERARTAFASRGAFVVALPGGSVATAFFPALAATPVDWSRTDFFWIDERAVPPADPASNFSLAAALWLRPASVPAGRIHRLEAEDSDAARAARAAAAELVRVAGNPPILDIALVGVGEDGHVASVFPSSGVDDDALVAVVEDAPKPPRRRLTLTLSVLASAGCVFVAAFGREKAKVLRDAVRDETTATPVGKLLTRAACSIVLLDRDAGELLC